MSPAELSQDHLDLVRQVLDHEIVDSNGVPCGVVDDLELEGEAGGELRVTALLVGPGAWAPRLPRLFGTVVRWIFGAGCTRVVWEEVGSIQEQVKLRSRAIDLGLGAADRKASAWIRRLPRS